MPSKSPILAMSGAFHGPPVPLIDVPRPLLDDSYAPEVRANVGLLAFARFAGNTVYRFAAPFLATIAAGLGVSLGRIGVALAIG